jgi:iron complex outermembrane receptor protein
MLSTIDMADQFRTTLTADYGQTRSSWAVFGDVSKKLAQQWTVGMGLRYTDERSNFQGSTIDNNPYGTSVVKSYVSTIPVFFNESFNDARWSGKGTVSYRPDADTTYYGSIGQGFKAGGFDGTTITSVPEAAPFKSETVLSYEAGVKFLPNGPIQVDASGFYYDYTDMQANTTKIVASLPTGVRTNVGKSRIYGAELNVMARPTRGLDLILGMSALNSRITEVVSDSPVEAARRLGNQVPNAPKFSARATVRYQYPVAADTVLVSSLTGRYVSEYFAELDNFQAIGGDFVADARMELRFGKRWTLAGWVRNITDRAYATGAVATTATMLNVYRAAPRTVGINASIKF